MALPQPLLCCCTGVPGCDFKQWIPTQQLEDVKKLCETHGAELVARISKEDGIGEVDWRDTLDHAGVEILSNETVATVLGRATPLGAAAPAKRARSAEPLSAAWKTCSQEAPDVILPLCLAPHDIKKKLAPGARGLDFGCGPGPALAAMLTEAGHSMAVFDPAFAPETDVLEEVYDFITCTEVLEHLHHPADVLDRFDRLLTPGGWLALMTCFQTEDALFANWRYRKEPTHVVFYREATLRLIAEERGWTCVIPVKDVALMRKAVE